MVFPFTLIRPSAIHFSASRREQNPARAITLAIRSPFCTLSFMTNSDTPMQAAIKEANKAHEKGEVPIGAVLMFDGKIVARSGNITVLNSDPTAHAEINVIRQRCAELGVQRLPDHDLYVTLEPCPMCAAAISFARIRTLYFGAYDPKGGGVDHGARVFDHPQCHHKPEIIGGMEEKRCGELLTAFFKDRR